MIFYQINKPFVPKYANYDYVKVYDKNDKFIVWGEQNILQSMMDIH